jgi:threonine/homoserine/homoserine lactone efflux protein
VADGGLARALATTFVLTITNPLTIVSFIAIFAGAGLARPEGDYWGAGVLVLGVFLGSALWWLVLSLLIGAIHHRLERRGMVWINRGSGALIFAFGLVAWASLLVGV